MSFKVQGVVVIHVCVCTEMSYPVYQGRGTFALEYDVLVHTHIGMCACFMYRKNQGRWGYSNTVAQARIHSSTSPSKHHSRWPQALTHVLYMNGQSLRLGKAKQLCLKTTPFFSREKEELPQAGLEPVMFCIPGRRSTN